MCKMFEVVTGKKSKGSVDKLEGLTKMYMLWQIRRCMKQNGPEKIVLGYSEKSR